MTATLSTHFRPAVTTNPSTFAQRFGACWNRVARYFVHRADIAHLRALDDSALRDVGLERSQIEAAVRGFMSGPHR